MSEQLPSALIWQPSSGTIECYEARIVTTWSEYIRGVVIAEEARGAAGGYTAYIEYFKHGVARQMWGQRIFGNREQATAWCEEEIARLYSASRVASSR
ncbi:MAG: hypothetical protein IPO81_14195 [Kouleothrix sp.]|nr:hypothetical protein [Kouleothrix sp.]